MDYTKAPTSANYTQLSDQYLAFELLKAMIQPTSTAFEIGQMLDTVTDTLTALKARFPDSGEVKGVV